MNEYIPVRRFGALSSSIDPTKLSETVQALAKVLAGILVFAGVLTVGDSTSILANVNQIITQVLIIIPIAYSVWNSAQVIFGLIRKAIVAVAAKY